MAERPAAAPRPSRSARLWEWHAELDRIHDLTAGTSTIGHRVRYREQGTRRWSSFLLTTDDGATPTESMVLQAIEAHHAQGSTGARR